MATLRAAAVGALLALTAMCGGGTTSSTPDASVTPACIPGQSVACAGPGGCTGYQVCNANGSALGACSCADSGGSSGSTSSSGSGSTSSGASSSSSGDAASSSGSGSSSSSSSGAGEGGGSGGSSSGSSGVDASSVTVDDCPGPLGSTLVTALQAGGAVDAAMKWLYPYDQTVFPRGLAAPVLQWSAQSGGTLEGVYLHMKSQLFEYKGCFGPTSPTHMPIPDAAWSQALALSGGASDPLTVELTTSTGGTVSGPIREQWILARGSLPGLVYFDTYSSPQVGNNGAVMMLRPGSSTPTPVLAIAGSVPTGPCVLCHSLSASGSMLAAQKHSYPGGLQSPGSMTFNLANGFPNATTPTPLASITTDDWGLSAVYPDGSRLLTAGEPADSTMVTSLFPVANPNNPGMIGPKANAMYDTSTGATIAFSGLSCAHAMMPSWSSDGKKIVYNDVDNHGGHALVVQDFNPSTNVFSNPVVIFDDPTNYPGWPTFTPDGASVVFSLGPSSNYSTIPPASFSGVGPVQASASDVASSDLYIVSVSRAGLLDAGAGEAGASDAGDAGAGATSAQPLALANGFRAGTSYLPFGVRDQRLNFYPAVAPVASGGYLWVVFTSRRQYGNVMVDTSNNNAVPDPVFYAATKKIWVTALSLSAAGDPSHPAFYLPGQEAASGAVRPVSALAPCAANGHACSAGVQCCAGACVANACASPANCSAVDDRCTTSAGCCDGSNRCIGGYCATTTP